MDSHIEQAAIANDVAMFIDWENMHGFIRGKANISALREVAEGYGRFVLAKAYADWRERRAITVAHDSGRNHADIGRSS